MNELALKKKVLAYLKNYWPIAWVVKISDKFQSGLPDIFGCYREMFFAIELKSPRGKVTRLQQHVMKKIMDSGGKVCIARSVDKVALFMDTLYKKYQIKMNGGDKNE